MGGSSSSSEASTSQTDNRRVLGQGSLSSENSTISQSYDGRQFDSSLKITNTLDNGAINRAFDTADFSVGESLGFAGDSLTKSLDFSGDTARRAFNLTGDSLAKSLDFSGDTTRRAFDFSGDTASGAFSFGKNALSEVADSQTNAYDFSRNSSKDAFAFARDAGSAAYDSLNTNSEMVKNAYADAKGRGALTDKILIGAIAMAGLVAFAAVRK